MSCIIQRDWIKTFINAKKLISQSKISSSKINYYHLYKKKQIIQKHTKLTLHENLSWRISENKNSHYTINSFLNLIVNNKIIYKKYSIYKIYLETCMIWWMNYVKDFIEIYKKLCFIELLNLAYRNRKSNSYHNTYEGFRA